MKMNLAAKIVGMVFIPFASFVIISAMMFKDNWNKYEKQKFIQTELNVLEKVSQLVNALQAERGKSAVYLSGGSDLGPVEMQRQKVNDYREKLLSYINNHHFDQNEESRLIGKIKEIDGMRNKVNDKAGKGLVVKGYSQIIGGILKSYQFVANQSDVAAVSNRVKTMGVFEFAKDNAGKLRANISGALAANMPISGKTASAIISMKGNLDGSLNSPSLTISSEIKSKIDGLSSASHWQAMNAIFTLVLAKANTGGYNKDAAAAFGIFSQGVSDVGSLVNMQREQTREFTDEVISDTKSALWTLGLILVGLTSFLVIVTVLVIRAITKPIQNVISNMSESAGEVSSASNQLKSASQQLSSGATEAASSLEETVSSLEELSSMVKLNADNAKESASLADKNRTEAESGEAEIRQLISAMNEIAQGSKKIEEIINVIDDIAFQTNLLALNAAVEAARAGEQGKGFAVVAEAVRNLAQRSAAAAKDIASLIKESVEKTENGSNIAGKSGDVLKSIVSSVTKVADLNNEIASASQEQATGISQVSKAMNQLDESTQRNAAAAEEVAASSGQMSEQAGVLDNLVVNLTEIVDGNAKGGTQKWNSGSTHRSSSNGDSHLQLVNNHQPTHKPPKQSSAAQDMIPFDDDESVGKIGNVDGF